MGNIFAKLRGVLGRRKEAAEVPLIDDTKIIGLFDLSKKQQDEQRKRRRRKLLKRSLFGMIPLFLLALWFILPIPITHQVITEYGKKNYTSARTWTTPLTWTSPEPFVAAYNSGTVDARQGKFTIAQAELENALKLAPQERKCMVVQNLAATHTAHAASLKGNEAAKKYTDLANKYRKEFKQCFNAIMSKDKEPADGQGGGGGGGAQMDTMNAAQPEKLREKNEAGQASQQPNINQLIHDANSPSVKPW